MTTNRSGSGNARLGFLLLIVLALIGLSVYSYSVGLWRLRDLALCIFLFWLLAMLCSSLFEKFVRSQCSVCKQQARFMLTKETAKKSGESRRYCLEHFKARLNKALDRYHGNIVIVEPDPNGSLRQGQWFFYKPEDLKKDSYSDTDVEAAKRLLALLEEATGSPQNALNCARIPNESVKRSLVDGPLFRSEPDQIRLAVMDSRRLRFLIEGVLPLFDQKAYSFRMNLPYGDGGIYLWHNYV